MLVMRPARGQREKQIGGELLLSLKIFQTLHNKVCALF